MKKKEYDKKEFKKLQKENEDIRDRIEAFCDDFDMVESRADLWKLINELIENELSQEEMCN